MPHRELFPGHFLLFRGAHDSPHWFGGEHDCQGAWCPSCNLPLMSYLTLDTSDPTLNLQHLPFRYLRLLYCMRCALCWYNFSYRIVSDDKIEVLEQFFGETTWEDWYAEGRGDCFARRVVGLARLPRRLQELYDRLNGGDELSGSEEAEIASFTGQYAHPEVGSYPIVDVINQIGGRSFLCLRIDDPYCPGCKRAGFKPAQTYFLASLTNDEKQQVTMAHDGVQIIFFLCPRCHTVTVRSGV